MKVHVYLMHEGSVQLLACKHLPLPSSHRETASDECIDARPLFPEVTQTHKLVNRFLLRQQDTSKKGCKRTGK